MSIINMKYISKDLEPVEGLYIHIRASFEYAGTNEADQKEYDLVEIVVTDLDEDCIIDAEALFVRGKYLPFISLDTWVRDEIDGEEFDE